MPKINKESMRQLTCIIVLLLAGLVKAQEGPSISSAIIAIRDNEVAEAKEYIDEADEIISSKPKSEVKSKDLAKFYYYKGFINHRVFQNAELSQKYPNALEEAFKAFKNSLEHEKKTGKERFTEESQKELIAVANSLGNKAIQLSQQGKHKQAFDLFMKSYTTKKMEGVGIVDTSMLNNASIMAINAGMTDTALGITKKLIEMEYMGRTYKATNKETGEEAAFKSKDQMEQYVKLGKFENPQIEGDLRPDLYSSLANLYLQSGDTAKYRETVTEARKKYPNNQALLRAELQIFLDSENYEKAMANLNQAIKADPDNKLFYYIKGNILHTQMKEYDRAREAYSKAAEVDSSFVDPVYMQGLTYVERGNRIAKEMNELPLSAEEKYEKLKKEQKQMFEKALPLFERAYKIDPKDKDTLNALAEVYQKLKMYEKAKKIRGEIAALK